MDSESLVIVFAVISLIVAILSMIFITPRSRKPYLNGFFRWLHGVFNFDALLIDKILKFLYIFSTVFVICVGFLGIIQGFRVIDYTGDVLLYGFLVLVLGPFVVRLFYELLMMMVILVKHVAEINRKVKDENPGRPSAEPFAPEAPAPAARPAPRPAELICPSCGAKMRPGSKFCGVCGYRVESAPAAAPDRNNYYPTDSDL